MNSYYSIALEEACSQLRKKLINYSDGQKDTSETIVKKSKTMYIVKNRVKKD